LNDWEQLRSKAEESIRRFCLPEFAEQWLGALLPVLDRFVDARRGEPIDPLFWEWMVKEDGTSGSGAYNWISGWINVFLPILGESSELNPFCVPYSGNPTEQYGRKKECPGPRTELLSDGMSSAPVTFDDQPLEFRAGFVGTEIDSRGMIKAGIGWFVASANAERTAQYLKRHMTAHDIITNVKKVVPLLPFGYPESETIFQEEMARKQRLAALAAVRK